MFDNFIDVFSETETSCHPGLFYITDAEDHAVKFKSAIHRFEDHVDHIAQVGVSSHDIVDLVDRIGEDLNLLIGRSDTGFGLFR